MHFRKQFRIESVVQGLKITTRSACFFGNHGV